MARGTYRFRNTDSKTAHATLRTTSRKASAPVAPPATSNRADLLKGFQLAML